ncbi:DUF5655 domain-containing protein [Pseudarthrobacter sp. N5]|uniref:DUF5655 domain-containing protein n=1 Tax=Pseudarthrobacter sp. N5 TaxID=3418416 RepID=UPI003CF1138B
MNHDVGAYLAGKPAAAVELFKRSSTMVLEAGECEERVHPSDLAWADKRVFAAAFIQSGRLGIAIDMLRQVEHPTLLEGFATTKKVYTHRFKIESPEDLDGRIRDWLVEAQDTVGPGTR